VRNSHARMGVFSSYPPESDRSADLSTCPRKVTIRCSPLRLIGQPIVIQGVRYLAHVVFLMPL
jgi:hypothetical protein